MSHDRDLLDEYDYDLPGELIAQEPPLERGTSRLLVLRRNDGAREHRSFTELPSLLNSGDLLVLNETRVFPARLRLRRSGGGAGELLLLETLPNSRQWQTIGRPGRALQPNRTVYVAGDSTEVHVVERRGELVSVELRDGGATLSENEVLKLCERAGEVPLPPYIKRERCELSSTADNERYQTVYARQTGSAAAPTAGLHLTDEILTALDARGVEVAKVCLHVGLSTFQPLTEEKLKQPTLHEERFHVSERTRSRLRETRERGGRVVAVGTTTVRALESVEHPNIDVDSGRTALFIKPGHVFKSGDALITNFHLPRSSLLLLVSAFAGRETVLKTYREAVARRYRFYSYGDAVLIL